MGKTNRVTVKGDVWTVIPTFMKHILFMKKFEGNFPELILGVSGQFDSN